MPLKTFFDLRMGFLLFSLALVGAIMMAVAPPGILDTRWIYTYAEAVSYLRGLKPSEAHNYMIVGCLDLLFIFKYTRCLQLSFERLFPEPSWVLWLAFVPGFFDVIETTNILFALYKNNPTLLLSFLGSLSFIKWTSGAVLTGAIFYRLFLPKKN